MQAIKRFINPKLSLPKFTIIALISMLSSHSLFAQPYVDLIQFRYTHAFQSGENNDRGTPFVHNLIGLDIPFEIKNKTYIIFRPYYESWQIDSGVLDNIVPEVKGLVLPVGILFPINTHTNFAIIPMVRTNGQELFAENTLQIGGISFISFEKSANKKIRVGLYVNSDFFGFYWRPLLGVNWQINDRNTMFGLLPGRLSWEHNLNAFAYTGITFRGITNSYRLNNGNFLRVDDNQLSAFLDIYPVNKICLTIEPGYSAFRKLRTGDEPDTYDTNAHWADGFFIKVSAAYRIRL